MDKMIKWFMYNILIKDYNLKDYKYGYYCYFYFMQ